MEYKFRAWDNIENRMYNNVETGIYQDPDEIIPFGKILEFACYEVMQFTGLKDKNGKEIYEGDILKYYSISENYFIIIRFGEYKESCGSNLGFYVEHIRKRQRFYRQDLLFWVEESEVIGTIYENPELLEVEK